MATTAPHFEQTGSTRPVEPTERSTNVRSPRTALGWTNAIATALDLAGVDSQILFEQSGVPYHANVDPCLRVETKRVSDLLGLAVKATGDPSIGLKIAAYTPAAGLHALGFSPNASRTLFDYCTRLIRFVGLLSDNYSVSLCEGENCYRLILDVTNDETCDELVDCAIAWSVLNFRRIYRPEYAPMCVDLTRCSPPTNVRAYEHVMRSEVRFDREQNILYIDKDDMFVDLPMSNAEIARRNDEIVIEHLARLEHNNIVRRVEAEIVDMLPSGKCSMSEVAERLDMNARRLSYMLEKKNTCFRQIKEELQRQLAEQYLMEDHSSITRIAFVLGFNDTSNFTRAFKRWTGRSPKCYRQDHLGPLTLS